MTSAYRQQQMTPYELDLTIVSAKHLKNVNWRSGELKPYCVFWLDPSRLYATKCDESGSTRPVWNERFSLPLPDYPSSSCSLTLEVYHNCSDAVKPLVGALRIKLNDMPEPDAFNRIRSFELNRPSGRPQGKIRVQIGICQSPFPPPSFPHHHHQDYRVVTPRSYYYTAATAPPPPRDYHGQTPAHSLSPSPSPPPFAPPYPLPTFYYPGHYAMSSNSAVPPLPRPSLYGGAPSAPVDVHQQYDQRQRVSAVREAELGSRITVGEVTGAINGLSMDDRLKFEDDKVSERAEKGIYRDYRAEM